MCHRLSRRRQPGVNPNWPSTSPQGRVRWGFSRRRSRESPVLNIGEHAQKRRDRDKDLRGRRPAAESLGGRADLKRPHGLGLSNTVRQTAGSGVRRLDSFQDYRCSTTDDSVVVKSVRALKLPHRGLGISAEVTIYLGTQQAQASKHALQAADIGAIVTEPQRFSSVLRHQPPPVWSLAGDTSMVRTNHFGKLPVSSISHIPLTGGPRQGAAWRSYHGAAAGMGRRSRSESGRGSRSCCRLQ